MTRICIASGRKPEAERGPHPNCLQRSLPPTNPATYVQVVPTELILKPGDKVNFRVRLFDAQGNFIREEPSATWALDQLKGTVTNGQFVAASDSIAQAGSVKATVGGITGSASVRVFPAAAVERELRRDGRQQRSRRPGSTPP